MLRPKTDEGAEIIIDFQPVGKRVRAGIGQTLLSAAQGIDLFEHNINAPCGGQGLCLHCLVKIGYGQVSLPSEIERVKLSDEQLAQNYRLACQTTIVGSCKVEIPASSLVGRQQLQIDGCVSRFETDCLTQPAAARTLGLAIDLGTTKIAAFLAELGAGIVLASEGILNPQIACGEDLMSRLNFALKTEANARRMAALAADGINELIERLILKQRCQADEISQVTIAANSAMHHLLLDLPLNSLARSPYLPFETAPLTVPAQRLGLRLPSETKVYLMGLVGGFIGSDHVAMIQASGIDKMQAIVLGIDIGTNTEIVLADGQGNFSSCSCASGPAFEGAHIYQGMRAVDGAISQVSLFNNGEKVTYQTIGRQKPIGFCGSGIISLIAELHKNGLISVNGQLALTHPRVRKGAGMAPEFLVAGREESGCDTDLVLTQNDITEIQLAKAAIAAGIKSLLNAAGITAQEVAKIIIAGAFGSFLKIESAVAIGMLPKLPLESFIQVGNAAGAGACMNLFSARERRRNEELAKKITHVELAVLPKFKRDFAQALKFPGLNSTAGKGGQYCANTNRKGGLSS